jgi:hypothetical protein
MDMDLILESAILAKLKSGRTQKASPTGSSKGSSSGPAIDLA